MANNTITQGATPEKEWFTLQEVAERWGFTEKDVMKLAMDGKIKVLFRYSRLHKKAHYVSIGVPSLEALERTKTLWLEDSTGKKTHVKRENLLVSRAEVERIEKAHSIGQPAQQPKLQNDKLDTRKETTYLQIIRALLNAGKYPPEPYKAADALMAHAAKEGLTLPAKRDTVAEKIKAAYDLSD